MKRIIFIGAILLSSFGVGAQLIANHGNIGGSYIDPNPAHPYELKMVYNYVSGNDMLLYVPNEVQPAAGWPLIIWGHGNGERGNPVSAESNIGTGNGSTTNFTGNLSNTNDQVLHTSAKLQVAGVTVCEGSFGVFNCPGVVTGTYDYKDPSASAVNVTFTTAPASGTISVEFIQSNMFDAGLPPILNAGDMPPKFIIACPQISAGTGGFTATNHWDAVLSKLASEGYSIDLNRVMWMGLSLGADGSNIICLTAKSTEFAAFIAAATGSSSSVPSGGSASYVNASQAGKLYLQGSTDSNGFSGSSAAANSNTGDRVFPVQNKIFWGVGHTGALWDTQVFNRKDRTDQTGTASFDYINDWFALFSLDDEQQATYWTEYAERKLNHEVYRVAKRQVDLLSSGAVKTDLSNRLATVKTTIGKAILIDFGAGGFTSASPWNNISNPAAGTTLNNLIYDDASASVIDFTLTTASATTPTMLNDLGAQRLRGRQFGGELNTFRDGMLLDADGSPVGVLTFSSLDNAKTYTFRIWCAASNSSFSARAEVEITIGATTKTMYCDLNNWDNFLEFTSVAPSSGNVVINISVRQTASTERDTYLQAIEIVTN